MTVTPVLDIQARIASIHSNLAARLPASGPVAGGVLGSGTLASAPASTGTFATDLQQATAAMGTNASAVGSPGQQVTGEDVVKTAREYLGVPYVWGGNDPKTGLDCSGLTELVYKRLGIDIPPVSASQASAGTAVPNLAQARPGDLLLFGSPTNHVGIYAGNDKMIHAPRTGKSVEVSSVYETPTAIRRVLAEASPVAGAAAAAPAAGAAPVLKALAPYAGPVPASTPFAAEFRAAEAKHGVPARVLAAVARAESAFRIDAVSSAGARGLMQFMPGTARGLGVDPMNPASAIDGAARLLKRHVTEFGSLDLSLAAYNAGQGSVRKYGGIPPYAETRGYVQKILSSLNGSSL